MCSDIVYYSSYNDPFAYIFLTTSIYLSTSYLSSCSRIKSEPFPFLYIYSLFIFLEYSTNFTMQSCWVSLQSVTNLSFCSIMLIIELSCWLLSFLLLFQFMMYAWQTSCILLGNIFSISLTFWHIHNMELWNYRPLTIWKSLLAFLLISIYICYQFCSNTTQ